MSNEPRRVFVGLLPSGTVTFVGEGEVDPIARLIADAEARLAAERATAEKARLAAIADDERMKGAKAARQER
jgi:hypothetical protein